MSDRQSLHNLNRWRDAIEKAKGGSVAHERFIRNRIRTLPVDRIPLTDLITIAECLLHLRERSLADEADQN